MADHPSLFDPPPPAVLGARRRDAAIRKVGDAAPHPWWRQARIAIRAVARHHGTFTTDEVWALLDAGDAVPPPEPRAMGAAMRAAQRDGVCAPTDRVTPTVRPDAHRRPVRVWRSLP